MSDELRKKARNLYIMGLYAEKKGFNSEAVINYCKALFAVCDSFLKEKIDMIPESHTERFRLLQKNDVQLYVICDKLFPMYQATYTKISTEKEVEHVRKRVCEVFRREGIDIPIEEDL
ncbi:MAG: hypothetical protein QMC78_05270 [Methanocellales archaeon]|nr:hypothetical protein [Methanocellales archaeon]